MHGHFSRMRFDEHDRFSAVVALQGRVSMEADYNEHTAILQHYMRTLAVDLLGKHAWPRGSDAFKIGLEVTGGKVTDITVRPGHCYVDGMLVENPSDEASFYDQPDARFDPKNHPLPAAPYFVYLEVWERLVTFVEQPDIRDPALGASGPDSSARTKVVWQVRCSESLKPPPRQPQLDKLPDHWLQKVLPTVAGTPIGKDLGTVSLGVAAGKEDELCALSPSSGFRGLENQLYRIEIHSGGVLEPAPVTGGPAAPTFKWSRDNGSVVFRVDQHEAGSANVQVADFGRDDRYGLHVGDWVELVDDASVLNNEPADLRRVTAIRPVDRTVTLDEPPEGAIGQLPEHHPFLRRWDQQVAGDRPSGNAIEVTQGPLPLEDGIEVRFKPGSYRTGDYWVAPARVQTGELEWPRKDGVTLFRAPDGVRRSYVPLAYVRAVADPIDLRPRAV